MLCWAERAFCKGRGDCGLLPGTAFPQQMGCESACAPHPRGASASLVNPHHTPTAALVTLAPACRGASGSRCPRQPRRPGLAALQSSLPLKRPLHHCPTTKSVPSCAPHLQPAHGAGPSSGLRGPITPTPPNRAPAPRRPLLRARAAARRALAALQRRQRVAGQPAARAAGEDLRPGLPKGVKAEGGGAAPRRCTPPSCNPPSLQTVAAVN